MSDLATLIQQEIPEGQQNLETSYTNLERVAAYCEANYIQSSEKKAALDETMRYTVQSLASVAYQINSLALNLMQMLDLQCDKLADMESQVSQINQLVDIHKEKVARRAIGVLTSSKAVPRQHKIVAPAPREKPPRYIRRAIDLTLLDDLGHGVKLVIREPQLIHRTQSSVSNGSSNSNGGSTVNVGIMPIPPSLGGTLSVYDQNVYMAGRYGSMKSTSSASSKEYRAPVTVPPPNAPVLHGTEYVMQRYPYLVQTGQRGVPLMTSTSNYQTSQQFGGGGGGTPTGAAVLPFRQLGQLHYGANLSTAAASVSNTNRIQPPMLQHGGNADVGRLPSSTLDAEDLPPPPIDFVIERRLANESPPLPPPPMPDYSIEHQINAGGGLRRLTRIDPNLPEWVPMNFIEKVVAQYDYQAQKPDELSFQENAVIYVLRKNEDGWFEGVLDGVTGLFPGNYVESCL